MMTHRIVCGDAAVDEVEGPGLAGLVLGLELVPREVGRRGGGADAHVGEQGVLGDIFLGLRRVNSSRVRTERRRTKQINMQQRQNEYRCVHVLSLCSTHVVSGEDGWLEELDVEGRDDDVPERLADLGVAEELPDDAMEVLAVVLGPQCDALDETQKAAPAQTTRTRHSSQIRSFIR